MYFINPLTKKRTHPQLPTLKNWSKTIWTIGLKGTLNNNNYNNNYNTNFYITLFQQVFKKFPK